MWYTLTQFTAEAQRLITWFHVLFNRSNKTLIANNLYMHSPSIIMCRQLLGWACVFLYVLTLSHEVDLLYECLGSVDKVTVNDGYRFALYLLMPDVGSVWGATFDKQSFWSHWRRLLFLASWLLWETRNHSNEFTLTEVSYLVSVCLDTCMYLTHVQSFWILFSELNPCVLFTFTSLLFGVKT